MKLEISGLKTERQWRSNTGMDKSRFYMLLQHFSDSYKKIFGIDISERTSVARDKSILNTYEDLLLFTLFSLKSGMTYDCLGFACGMDGSNAKRNQSLGLEVLKLALSAAEAMPMRGFENPDDLKMALEGYGELIIDATEQRIQRPSCKERQKGTYSGKKKPIH